MVSASHGAYDNLVYKYAIRFNEHGLATHKIYIRGVVQTEPPTLHVISMPMGESLFNFFEEDNILINHFSVPGPETELWNIYFDYFELEKAFDKDEFYVRIRQKMPSISKWQHTNKRIKTNNLLEDN